MVIRALAVSPLAAILCISKNRLAWATSHQSWQLPGTKLQVKIQDQLWDCEVVEDSPYDPKNENIRLDG